MNDLQVFEYDVQDVRATINDGEPWFVLKDVCAVLELTNSRMVAERLDDDERRKLNLPRQGKTWFVNESGLYSVILRSDKHEARQFRRWVTHEVLPTIRKTGQYAITKTKALPDSLKEQRVSISKQNADIRRAQMWIKLADRENNVAIKRGYEQRAARILAGEDDTPLNLPVLKTAYELGENAKRWGHKLMPPVQMYYFVENAVASGLLEPNAGSKKEKAYQYYKDGYNS